MLKNFNQTKLCSILTSRLQFDKKTSFINQQLCADRLYVKQNKRWHQTEIILDLKISKFKMKNMIIFGVIENRCSERMKKF